MGLAIKELKRLLAHLNVAGEAEETLCQRRPGKFYCLRSHLRTNAGYKQLRLSLYVTRSWPLCGTRTLKLVPRARVANTARRVQALASARMRIQECAPQHVQDV